MKHTPGPWTVEEYGDDETPALVIHKDSNSRVCFMATPGSHGDPAKIEADAHLIAAAPELLLALVAATKNMRTLEELWRGNGDDKMADMARINCEGYERTIAKARGTR